MSNDLRILEHVKVYNLEFGIAKTSGKEYARLSVGHSVGITQPNTPPAMAYVSLFVSNENHIMLLKNIDKGDYLNLQLFLSQVGTYTKKDGSQGKNETWSATRVSIANTPLDTSSQKYLAYVSSKKQQGYAPAQAQPQQGYAPAQAQPQQGGFAGMGTDIPDEDIPF